jgi:hypothetical protein
MRMASSGETLWSSDSAASAIAICRRVQLGCFADQVGGFADH